MTSTGRASAPTLSPDGTRIAYVSNDAPEKKLMVQDLSGGPALAIFSAPEVGHLRWSPDGTELLIWARGSGSNGVYVMSQLGGSPRRVAPGLYVACWSPDGSTIAVASYLDGRIWLRDRLGRELRTLSLHGKHWSIGDLDWSPANGLLAFVSNDYQGRFSVWTIRPDGTDQRRVVADSSEIASVRWTPDGDGLYYSRRLNQTVSIARISGEPGRGSTGRPAAPLSSRDSNPTGRSRCRSKHDVSSTRGLRITPTCTPSTRTAATSAHKPPPEH